ncbi:MAG TPA: nitrous oxide reductase accessory protein NosL [Bacillales bacterium]|nr:nitrous oxide reductase accessory protein NosL [Bacillales bacterium]
MRLNSFKLFFITIIGLLVITGCGKKEYKPVAINEKTDKCDVCHMQVKDNQFATEIILENGKSFVFDDIGCMYKWMKKNKDKKIANSYVKDFQTKEWIELEKASFVYNKPIRTPMAYNVLSFANKKDAQTYIDQKGGKLLSYKDLSQHSWERNKEMVKEMKEKMKQMKMGDGMKKDSGMNMDMN